jgi:hypothetical protein
MRAIRAGAVIAGAAAVLASACRSGDGDPPDPRPTVVELPATPNRDLDLLFVIDDSPGLIEGQGRLAASFPILLDRLRAVPGGLPNLHIGVISTDMGTKASGSPTPAPPIGQPGMGGCSDMGKGGALQVNKVGTDLSGKFVIDVEQTGGGRMKNYTGELSAVFGKLIAAGAGGCGFEQPLAALRAALDENPANAGFVRDKAILGVVLLTDEDDCSAASPQLFDPNAAALGALQSFRCTQFGVTCAEGGKTTAEMGQVGDKGKCSASEAGEIVDGVAPYRDFLLGLKRDPRRVAVGGIVGPAAPVAVELRAPPGGVAPVPGLTHACSFQGQIGIEVADPAPRLEAFRAGFGDRGELATVCKADYTDSVTRIGDLLRRSMGSACVEAVLADADPDAPGTQPACVVDEVIGAGAALVPACEVAAGARPCWRLEEDPAGCGLSPAPHLALRIDRDGAPDPATITKMRCVVAP